MQKATHPAPPETVVAICMPDMHNATTDPDEGRFDAFCRSTDAHERSEARPTPLHCQSFTFNPPGRSEVDNSES